MSPELQSVIGLATAALGGAAVGLEREWSGHGSGPQAHFAGIRTFTLLGGVAGMSGWLWSLHYTAFSAILLAAGAALVLVAYAATTRREVEATTEVAALVVLGAGLVAGIGHLRLASAIFAITVLLLAEKSQLHSMVARIDDTSLRAGVRFAVMAIVILPLLPEGPYGPLGGFRPRLLWMLTLFFSGLSFAGYIARRLVGDRYGYPLAGLLGGIVSSTNVTLTFARLSRGEERLRGPLAMGVVAACTVLFLRTLIAALVLNAEVAWALIPYCAAAFLLGTAALLPLFRRLAPDPSPHRELKNPLQLSNALQMALLFQVVLFAVYLMQQRFGDVGVFATAAVVGLTDTDALTIAMARNASAGAPTQVAAQAITVGITANTILKMLVAVALGREKFRFQAGLVLSGMAVALAGSLFWLR